MFCGVDSYNTYSNRLSAFTVTVATRLLLCRWYVVRSWPRNERFRCVKSLLLLWKPHSWF